MLYRTIYSCLNINLVYSIVFLELHCIFVTVPMTRSINWVTCLVGFRTRNHVRQVSHVKLEMGRIPHPIHCRIQNPVSGHSVSPHFAHGRIGNELLNSSVGCWVESHCVLGAVGGEVFDEESEISPESFFFGVFEAKVTDGSCESDSFEGVGVGEVGARYNFFCVQVFL